MRDIAKPQLFTKTPRHGYALLTSWERALRANLKSPGTIKLYKLAGQQFLDFCAENNMPDIEGVSREHVDLWLIHLAEKGLRPSTIAGRLVQLRIFMHWLVEEGEISKDPTARVKKPAVSESLKDIVATPDISKCLKYLEKMKRWRDAALVAVTYDTGMRCGELSDAESQYLDLDSGVLVLPDTKGKRVRMVHLGAVAIRYLDRYFRKPRKDPRYVFNGNRGKLTRSSIYGIIRKSFAEIGVKGIIGPHDLRHTSASHTATTGLMSESDMMVLFGWKEADMARHYTRQVAQQKAIEAHRKASPLDNLERR